jgi:hypothetical protein
VDGLAFATCASPKAYTISGGSHRFEVKARNAAGVESGVAAATWTVDVLAPTVAVSSPTTGAQVSSTVQVVATAGDNLGIARVEMRIDGSLKGTSTVTPHSFSWDTTRETNGQHVVELRSVDTAGNVSAPVTSTYVVSNLPSGGSCSGVQVAPGVDALGAAIAANSATTFCLRAGVHRLTSAVVAKAGSTFVGEPGAIISGARDITGLFQQSGSAWVAGGMSYEGTGTAFEDPCGPPWGPTGSTLCLRTNNVFYDDRWLTRVGSLSELSSGEFYFDYGADRIYIADSPAGHKVEVAVSPQAFRSHGTGAYNVTIRGLVVEKFANPISTHAIEGNDGWVLESVEVRFNHGCGASGNVVRASLFHDNGQCGFTGSDDSDIVVENSEFYENHRVPVVCWHTASVKILRSQNAIVRGNYSHDEDCLGLWTDWDNIGTLFENNRTERIGGPGIFHEASFDAVIRNNVVRDSGYWREFDGWIDGSGILVNSSRNVEIYGNTVEGNRHGIGATNTTRGSNPTYGGRETRNLRVHDNTIRVGAGRTAGGVAGIIYQPFSGQALFTRNTYVVCSSSVWTGPKPAGSSGGGDLTWAEWRAQGQDANSTASFNC